MLNTAEDFALFVFVGETCTYSVGDVFSGLLSVNIYTAFPSHTYCTTRHIKHYKTLWIIFLILVMSFGIVVNKLQNITNIR